MAENLTKRPAKGILKASSSFDQADKNVPDIKWDEMNILQTLHPPDKDYGHMKIEEPKTPYSYYEEGKEVSEHIGDCLDASTLTEKINLSSDQKPKALISSASEDDDDEYADETEEERAQRKAFEQKRKMHYNEFQAVKLARKLIARDDDDDDDEEDDEDDETKNGEIEIDK